MADGRAACRRPRRSTTRTMIDPIMFSRSIAWNLILRKSALGFRPGVLERADQQQGKQAGPLVGTPTPIFAESRSEEHTSELQSLTNIVCRLLLEKKKKTQHHAHQSM